MAEVTSWKGTDGPDSFVIGSSSKITLAYSYAGNDTLTNMRGNVYIDAGTDNNNVSLAANGGNTVISGNGNDTINVASASGGEYNNFISVSGGDNLKQYLALVDYCGFGK